MVHVAIAGRNDLFCEGIRHTLSQEHDVEITGLHSSGKECLTFLTNTNPEIAVLDVDLPDMNAVEVTRKAYRRGFNGKIIIMSDSDVEELLRCAMRMGASSYLSKSCRRDELVSAFWEVASGGKYISPKYTHILLKDLDQSLSPNRNSHGPNHLTDRQFQILRAVAEGMTSKEIAETYFVSVRTIDFHRRNIMRKLGIHDLPTLVRFAVQTGVVDNTPYEPQVEEVQDN